MIWFNLKKNKEFETQFDPNNFTIRSNIYPIILDFI